MADEPKPKCRRLRYTVQRRRDFIRVLAETYDPDKACEAAGLTWPQICELRARHPDFALRFEEVIAAGYDRLEAALLRQAGVGTGAGGKADLMLAPALLKQRRALKEAPGAARRGPDADKLRKQQSKRILNEFAPLRTAVARGEAERGGQAKASGTGTASGGAGPRP